MTFKIGTPRGTSVGKENIDVVCRLRDLSGQALDLGDLGGIGGDGDGDSARALVWEGIESSDGLVTCLCLSRGDIYFGTSCLEEPEGLWLADTTNPAGWAAYPEATLRPSPRLPPVTTATLPSRLKMLPKSWSWTSIAALPIVALLLRKSSWGG